CLLLDEPTAVLTPQEARQLLATLRELIVHAKPISEGGPILPHSGLLIVTHKLDEVIEVADRAGVLRAGRIVNEYPRSAFSAREMADSLVGHEVIPVVRDGMPVESATAQPPAAALAVRDLWVVQAGVERVRGVSLDLRPGSILGLGGVEGNGQSEL